MSRSFAASPDLVCGVDGGGTKTIALVGRADGSILGAGRGGISCIYRAGSPEGAIDEVSVAVSQAAAEAGVTPEAIRVAVFSLAGADWPEDFAYLDDHLSRRFPGTSIVVVNDALSALRAGTADGIGACVVAGTGGNVAARGPRGRVWHASFWLPVPSGATIIARNALMAAVFETLGIGPPSAITGRLGPFFGLASVEEVLHAFTSRLARPAVELAPFARVVMDIAAEGDMVAREIVERLGRELGRYVGVAAGKAGLEGDYRLVLAGGLFHHDSDILPAAIASVVPPDVRLTRVSPEPAVGALLMAIDRVGEPLAASELRGIGLAEAALP